MSDVLQEARRAHDAGNFAKAAELYTKALRANPKDFDALYLLGFLHLQQGDFAEAERFIGEALKINPRSLDALFNRGRALQQLGRHEEALAAFDAVLAIHPGIVEAQFLRGNLLMELNRWEEALASFDRVVRLKPDSAEAWNNLGNVLGALQRQAEALQCYDRALAIRPGDLAILNHRGITLFELKRYEEAAWDYAKVLEADPRFPFARGSLLQAKLHCCDWRGLDEERAELAACLRTGEPVATPIQHIVVSSSAEEQALCSRIWTEIRYPPSPSPLWRGERYGHSRIRVAYLSADFHSHATAALLAGVLERHDKTRFETTAISFGPDDGSEMRARLVRAFDRFVDVRDRSDRAVARLLRDMEIDIAVDLKGHTQDARPGIVALRPAPVQINYLGYPGTMGARYIDYIIADRIVIPPDARSIYSEKVVYLPDTYQGNDTKRRIAETTPSRSEAGLPAKGFVFASFNNNYKIGPQIFAVWMRLLDSIEGSVLWLLEDNPAAARNLRREAQAHGVAPNRLVFAPRVSLDRHLARHRLAELFLDTLPYGAHTTASDALWAGLPVLTICGESFAGRVAASVLTAAGLPELVTYALPEYEALALKLGREPAELAAIKSKLERNRTTCALFDTARFVRHLEAAYIEMWRRHERGEAPASFTVPTQAETSSLA